MKKICFLMLSLIMAMAIAATAQTPGGAAVKWRTSVSMKSPTEGTVTVRAIIPEGWHIYGMHMPEGGPKATSLDFAGSTGVEFAGQTKAEPAPTKGRDEAFGEELEWWEGRVAFTRRFRVTDAAKARINLKATYMSCSGTNCLPPRSENISVPVPAYKKN